MGLLVTDAGERRRNNAAATTVISSGSESSDGGGCSGGIRGTDHRRLPVSRNGSYRQPLSPMSARAMSPSLRSLKVPGSPSAAALAAGSASLNSTVGGGQHVFAHYQHHLDAAASPTSPLRSWSDAVSVRSLASIGMGSTDGRKLTITKVPTSPAELLNLASPQT